MSWTLWLPALAPLPYALAALAPVRGRHALGAGLLASKASLLLAFLGLAALLGPVNPVTPTLGLDGLGFAVRLDTLSVVLCLLIAFLGAIVVGYSRNYLDGDPRHPAFVRGLCLTLGFVEGLVLSGNLVQIIVCWIGAGLCVNWLLLFRGERQAAVLAARKRFLVSRVADLCLIAAAILLWRVTGSGDIGVIAQAAKDGLLGWTGGAAALLIAAAAVLASAQLPFHGWILEVMETPTPVSALLHAGVVNAGGFLVLRFSDLFVHQPAASLLLIGVGATTALFGSLVMLTQSSVKVSLAYSTIGQMGFMLLECGLGAYAAALLHICAHSLYKAHAFLTAGTLSKPHVAAPERALPGWALWAGPALVATIAGAAAMLGVGPAQHPGEFVLAAVVLLGLARLWLDAWTRRSAGDVLLIGGLSVGVLGLYVLAQSLFALLSRDVLPAAPAPGAAAIVAAILTVTAMTALTIFQVVAPTARSTALWGRVYAAVANGFYLNTLANRWVLRFWPTLSRTQAHEGVAP